MLFQFKVEFWCQAGIVRCLGEKLCCEDVVLQIGGTLTDGRRELYLEPGVYSVQALAVMLDKVV